MQPTRTPHDHAIAVRYQQASAEVRALQRQCYALATLRLRAAVDQAGGGAGLAILSDIDETILDSSAVMAAAMHNEACSRTSTPGCCGSARATPT